MTDSTKHALRRMAAYCQELHDMREIAPGVKVCKRCGHWHVLRPFTRHTKGTPRMAVVAGQFL